MAAPTLAVRMDNLERRVEALEQLPERMDRLELQIVQLRSEMHDGFSALRDEMRSGDEALRAGLRAGDEETRRLMRVLHEDVIGRIAALQEVKPVRHARRRKS